MEDKTKLERVSRRIEQKRQKLTQLERRQKLQEIILERVSSSNADFDSLRERIIEANSKFGFNEYHLENNRGYGLGPSLNKYTINIYSENIIATPFSEKQLKNLRNMSDPLVHSICNLALEYARGYGLGSCINFANNCDPINLILLRKMDGGTYKDYLSGKIPVFEREGMLDCKKYLFVGDTREKDHQKSILKQQNTKKSRSFFARLLFVE